MLSTEVTESEMAKSLVLEDTVNKRPSEDSNDENIKKLNSGNIDVKGNLSFLTILGKPRRKILVKVKVSLLIKIINWMTACIQIVLKYLIIISVF